MTAQTPPAIRATSALRHRWPTLVGLLAAAGLFLAGADRDTVAIVVAVAAVCYLAAAAFGLPWMAWAAIPGSFVVVPAGALLGLPPYTTLAAVSVLLVATGLLGRASRPALAAQTAALVVYGGVAVTALLLAPTAGLVLVALTLIGHGVWDVVHLRRRAVVSPSLAEACVALDVPLGLAVLATVLF